MNTLINGTTNLSVSVSDSLTSITTKFQKRSSYLSRGSTGKQTEGSKARTLESGSQRLPHLGQVIARHGWLTLPDASVNHMESLCNNVDDTPT